MAEIIKNEKFLTLLREAQEVAKDNPEKMLFEVGYMANQAIAKLVELCTGEADKWDVPDGYRKALVNGTNEALTTSSLITMIIAQPDEEGLAQLVETLSLLRGVGKVLKEVLTEKAKQH